MEVKMIWSFILLSLTTKCWSQTLIQSEAAVITPGGSHKLTCTASSLDFDGYWMGWIRTASSTGSHALHISAIADNSNNLCEMCRSDSAELRAYKARRVSDHQL
ncbi:hypothetical protein SRHO_G00190930 [Serrasalmus rhombeus]